MPSPAPKPRRLASIEVAAERLDLCPKSVRRLISSGKLPGYRVGLSRLIKVDLNDVDQLIQRIPTAS